MSRYDPARDCFTSDPAPAQHAGSDEPSSPAGPPSSDGPVQPSSPPPHERQSAPSSSTSPENTRKRKAPSESPSSSATAADSKPIPLTGASLPKIRKRRPGENPSNSNNNTAAFRGRDREPHPQTSKYLYNSPPPPIIPKASDADDPTPPPSRKSSPPRKRKKPGASSRISEAEMASVRAAAEAREKANADAEAARNAAVVAEAEKRRVQEQVRSHYNEKRELGKTWRQTSSRIKGLRSFNNWVKSSLIQKFSPNPDFDPRRPSNDPNDHLVVLDMGCGKGGDLLKWKSAPQEVGFYLGVDHADVSIAHARDRYDSMRREAGRRRGRGVFQAEFHALDCWSNTIDKIPIAQRIGFDGRVGPGADRMAARWGAGVGGFDVVSMMFCMHYAFETEAKCRTMLRNVAGALKKGGRFIGTIPSSDILSAKVRDVPESAESGKQEWGNSIYRIKFAAAPPKNGTFRPSWGWQYNFFLEEAVEEVPEYVVPWEAFRGLAEDYGLELEYKKAFHDVWLEEKEDREMRVLSERMGVRDRGTGELTLTPEEWEATGIYLAFGFRKT